MMAFASSAIRANDHAARSRVRAPANPSAVSFGTGQGGRASCRAEALRAQTTAGFAGRANPRPVSKETPRGFAGGSPSFATSPFDSPATLRVAASLWANGRHAFLWLPSRRTRRARARAGLDDGLRELGH